MAARPVHALSPPGGGVAPLHGTQSGPKPPSSLSWASSLPDLSISSSALRLVRSPSPLVPLPRERQRAGIVRAAWTRRSRGEAAKRPNRKSWKQRTDMYMRPFLLNIFFSNRFIHAKVMHRGTSKVISVASTNAKDLRNTLPSLTDNDACRTIGKLIAERSKDADVFAMAYEPRKGCAVVPASYLPLQLLTKVLLYHLGNSKRKDRVNAQRAKQENAYDPIILY